jgi:hypothetical protein
VERPRPRPFGIIDFDKARVFVFGVVHGSMLPKLVLAPRVWTRWSMRFARESEPACDDIGEDSLMAAVDGPSTTEQIVALERAALDRWGKGDPGGFLSYTDRESPTSIR